MIAVCLIALSLSADAFAVSVGAGIAVRELKPFHVIRAASAFGLFQALMPLAGWLLGLAFASYIESWDHWLAFGLLAFIGIKMAAEGFFAKPEDENSAGDVRNLKTLLTLAVATSIDALAVGVSYSALGRSSIVADAGLIGLITFAVCLAGFEAGRRIGALFEKSARILGGLVLVGIGVKILVEHLGLLP